MIFFLYALILLVLSAIPVLLIGRNLAAFKTASQQSVGEPPGISVLIPARNEAAGIRDTCRRVLENAYPSFELIVLDDHSTDQTASLVKQMQAEDSRVRLESSQPLPEGWNGKQFACWQLSQLARHDLLLFLDADVKVEADCLHRIAAEMHRAEVSLLSGFPAQRTETLPEQMLIPMMYYVLLGYLPFDQMRGSTRPEFGAGCGQMFLADRESYFQCGGHQGIRSSRHDGIKLPRCFREAGLKTDLFDASDIAEVRMYVGFSEVVNGVMKNATEGIANAKLIWIFSVLLLGGCVLPVFSLAHAIYYGWWHSGWWKMLAVALLAVASLNSFIGGWRIIRRFCRPKWVWVLQPISVLWFVCLQWLAFFREKLGVRPVAWRGRVN
ncbi:MAG: glycosyltransferase [bacterium]|nr:glycosyltransferase [bacterium]